MFFPTSMGHSWLYCIFLAYPRELRDSSRSDFAMQIRKALQPIPLHPAAPDWASVGQGVQLPVAGLWSYFASQCFTQYILILWFVHINILGRT